MQNELAPLSSVVAFSGDPMWRWKSVHQSFFLIIQTITIVASQFERANSAGDKQAADRALQRIVALLRGSAAAMRLSGSMSTEQYQERVRPDMMTGDLPEGFSGIMGADHGFMVRSLSKLRDALASSPLELKHVQDAIDYCYDAHVRVCERAEPKGTSLMVEAKGVEVGGVDALRRGGRFRERTHAKIRPADRIGD